MHLSSFLCFLIYQFVMRPDCFDDAYPDIVRFLTFRLNNGFWLCFDLNMRIMAGAFNYRIMVFLDYGPLACDWNTIEEANNYQIRTNTASSFRYCTLSLRLLKEMRKVQAPLLLRCASHFISWDLWHTRSRFPNRYLNWYWWLCPRQHMRPRAHSPIHQFSFEQVLCLTHRFPCIHRIISSLVLSSGLHICHSAP